VRRKRSLVVSITVANQSGSRRVSHPLLFLAPRIRRSSIFVAQMSIWQTVNHNEACQNKALGCSDLSFFPFVSAVPTYLHTSYMFQEYSKLFSSPAHYIYFIVCRSGRRAAETWISINQRLRSHPGFGASVRGARGKYPGCWCYRGYSLS
jgi:hypothetical protein